MSAVRRVAGAGAIAADARVRARVDRERPVENRVRSGQRRHHAAGQGSARSWSRTTSARRATWRSRRTATSTSRSEPRRTRPAGDRRRRRSALRDANGDGKFEMQGADRHRQHDRRRPAQRLSLPRAPEDDRAVQDDRGPAEADRRGRDRRQGSAARRAAAQRQGPDLRRQGLALHQRRRAEQRLSAARSSARREGRQDPCPILEKHGGVWKFDENKLGQTQDDGHEVRDRPAAVPRHHLARRRALHRDEQPRSARRRSGPTSSRRRTTPSGRPSRCTARSGVELRLAVLLLRLPAEEVRS